MKTVDYISILKNEVYLLNLMKSCDPKNDTNLSSLHRAVRRNDTIIIELLTNIPIDVQTENGNTSLLFACILPLVSIKTVRKLIDLGADVNLPNKAGFTPLLAACKQEAIDLVKLLLRKGADINHQDKCGYSALHYAVEKNNTLLVNLLLHYKIDTNLMAITGWTSLQPKLTEPFSAVKYLAFSGIRAPNPDTCTSYDWSCFMMAALNGNINIARKLVERGADVNVCSAGVTPALIAAEYYNDSIFELSWSSKTVEMLKKNNNLKKFIKYLLSSDWITPRLVSHLYKVLDTPGVNLKGGDYVKHLTYYVAYLENKNKKQKIDILGITKKLYEKGIEFNHSDIAGFISISCLYSLKYKNKLLRLLIRNGADFNLLKFLKTSVNNDPEFTITLLQYCICFKPSDVLNYTTQIKRADLSILKLIRFLLQLCTPTPNLRKKIRKSIAYINSENAPTYSTLYYHFDLCISQSFTFHYNPEETKLRPNMCNKILDLLSKYNAPSLKELSRDKIRECLTKSCSTTQDYLKKLKALQLPAEVIDIIQCKNTVISYE